MREILDACVRIDGLAEVAYRDIADRCTDASVAQVLRDMSAEESSHVGWWRELLAAWDAGLLPDIWADSDDVISALHAMVAHLEGSVPAGDEPIDAETALTTAARIEFFALDPLFAELIDLTEPAVSRSRHDAYARHVERLIAAVEDHFPSESLVGFLAGVLRRAQRENRVLARHATRDPLTGLANRRALTSQLLQWSAWAARYGRPITLVFGDVDHFKEVNDRYGHSTGDAVLRRIAAAIASTVRESDLAVRLGGDEFAVLAPELDVEGARALADRIIDAVRWVAVAGSDPAAAVTISVGAVVVTDPPNAEPRPVDQLMAAADQSLYAAKTGGRDRAADPVVLASEL
jgi:diguanylate cyclase (GGDEF)-like protein